MGDGRGKGAGFLGAVILLGWLVVPPSSWGQDLPPSILADQYLLAIKKHAEAGEHHKAAGKFKKILELDVEVPPVFWYHYGRNFQARNKPIEAKKALTKYVSLTGRQGKHYTEALERLNTVTPKAKARKAEQAERRRIQERAERQGLIRTLDNPARGKGDKFGTRVAIGAHGSHILIGAPHAQNRLGQVYLFDPEGRFQRDLLRGLRGIPHDEYEWCQFGYSMGVSADGSRFFLGSAADPDCGGQILLTEKGVQRFTGTGPSYHEVFGHPVALAGDGSRLLVSNGNQKKTSLLSGQGDLLQTFENPASAGVSHSALALSGNGHRILIGYMEEHSPRKNVGRAYLFNAEGDVLRHFSDPTPTSEDLFGADVAMTPDGRRILIGAPGDDSAETDVGQAHLFDAEGNLLRTYDDPTPTGRKGYGDRFGSAVAISGDGTRVLIGAPGHRPSYNSSGEAHLFDPEGNLLRSFDDPTPTGLSHFGESVAISADGTRILIGAPDDSTIAFQAGQAHLFDASDL
ncbi:WD40 repeat domain-containing protein [Thiohalorhabdus methylotrophus]|uniref:WD40 repeat domain-containing protein n=1 Tax=Thiohalorhabdus methylotrophus TaxID=3242694 RepID=A0ABV4TVH4_9GAMM